MTKGEAAKGLRWLKLEILSPLAKFIDGIGNKLEKLRI